MRLLMLQLSLFAVTVTSSQFSHVVIQQPKDVNSCGPSEQELNDLMSKNTELKEILTQIQEDVVKLTPGGATTPKNIPGELKKTNT